MKRVRWIVLPVFCFFAAALGVMAAEQINADLTDQAIEKLDGFATHIEDLRAETAALRDYCRQLPWPEDGWVFGEWTDDMIYVSDPRSRLYQGWWPWDMAYEDSLSARCDCCGKQHSRYELRGNR
jgi:hypothetical protein